MNNAQAALQAAATFYGGRDVVGGEVDVTDAAEHFKDWLDEQDRLEEKKTPKSRVGFPKG